MDSWKISFFFSLEFYIHWITSETVIYVYHKWQGWSRLWQGCLWHLWYPIDDRAWMVEYILTCFSPKTRKYKLQTLKPNAPSPESSYFRGLIPPCQVIELFWAWVTAEGNNGGKWVTRNFELFRCTLFCVVWNPKSILCSSPDSSTSEALWGPAIQS